MTAATLTRDDLAWLLRLAVRESERLNYVLAKTAPNTPLARTLVTEIAAARAVCTRLNEDRGGLPWE